MMIDVKAHIKVIDAVKAFGVNKDDRRAVAQLS